MYLLKLGHFNILNANYVTLIQRIHVTNPVGTAFLDCNNYATWG